MESIISSVRYGLTGVINLEGELESTSDSVENDDIKFFEMVATTTLIEWYGDDIVLITAQHTSESGIPPGKYRRPLPSYQGCVGLLFGHFYGLKQPEENNIVLANKMLEDYQKQGLSCFSQLNGGWVGFIWDQSEGRAHFIRDQVGIETFYVVKHANSIIFSTHLRFLQMNLGLQSVLDENAMLEFLHYLYVPAPRTLEKDCHAVLPGHIITIGSEERSLCFASSRFEIGPSLHDDYAVKERIEKELPIFENKLMEAVKDCIPSNGRIALMLSGGKDSSTLAVILSKLCPERVLCVNIGASDRNVDEAGDASLVAKTLGLEYMSYIPSDSDLANGLYEFASYQDQPIGDPAALPYFLGMKHLPEDCQVIIDGTGNDYYFGIPNAWSGIKLYERRKKLQKHFPNVVWTAFLKLLSLSSNYDSLREVWSKPIEETFVSWHGWSETELTALRQNEVSFEDTYLWKMMRNCSSNDWMGLLTNVICGVWEPHAAYRKGVHFAHSLGMSIRYPFVDNRLSEYVKKLPRELKFQGGTNKIILRAYMEKHLPQEVLDKPKGPFIFDLNRVLLNPKHNWIDQLQKEGLLKLFPEWSDDPIQDLKKLYFSQPSKDAPQQKIYALCLLATIVAIRRERLPGFPILIPNGEVNDT